MEEGSADDPPPNGFPIPEDEVYARTDIQTYEIIKFLVTKLQPVKLKDLDPDDRMCPICREDFCDSEDAKVSHPAVKTACGHVFCKYCIIKWLDPLCCWGQTESTTPLDDEIFTDVPKKMKTNCPTCRRVFFRKWGLEPMEALANRLWLWDNVYAFSGVARSQKEERTRAILWEHINYCRSIDQFKLADDVKWLFLRGAQQLLQGLAKWLKTQPLTPHQKRLRQKVERFGKREISEWVHVVDDGPNVQYVFCGERKFESTNMAVQSSNSQGKAGEDKERIQEIETQESGDEMGIDEGEGDEVSEESEEDDV